MKKLALALLCFALLSLSSKVVFAEDRKAFPFRVTKERVEAGMDKVKEYRDDKKENLKENMEARQDLRKENVARYLAKLVSRFKAMSQRLQTLVVRIEARLEKIATENPDLSLTAIEANLDQAKANLADANTQIADLEATANSLVDTEDPKGTLAGLRDKINPIVKNLKGAHTTLVRVIGQIKGLRLGNTTNESQ